MLSIRTAPWQTHCWRQAETLHRDNAALQIILLH